MSRDAVRLVGMGFLIGAITGAVVFGGPTGLRLPKPGIHDAWYASRSAGLVGYLCLWLALAGGLLMSSGWFDGLVFRGRLVALHQWSSVLGVAFGLYHGLLFIRDPLADFTVVDVLVPFASYYQPLLVGIGTLVLYLAAVVTGSFWFRSRIGPRRWRTIHNASFLVYAGALWHGAGLGTDSSNAYVVAMYVATSALIVVSVVVRLTFRRPPVRRATAGATA